LSIYEYNTVYFLSYYGRLHYFILGRACAVSSDSSLQSVCYLTWNLTVTYFYIKHARTEERRKELLHIYCDVFFIYIDLCICFKNIILLHVAQIVMTVIWCIHIQLTFFLISFDSEIVFSELLHNFSEFLSHYLFI